MKVEGNCRISKLVYRALIKYLYLNQLKVKHIPKIRSSRRGSSSTEDEEQSERLVSASTPINNDAVHYKILADHPIGLNQISKPLNIYFFYFIYFHYLFHIYIFFISLNASIIQFMLICTFIQKWISKYLNRARIEE